MSTRWALMKRTDIADIEEPGDIYLRRWRVVQTPLFAVYVHRIFRPDGDRHMHDHPWNFVSVILRGSYTEQVATDNRGYGKIGRTWRPASVHRLKAEAAHRIATIEPSTWTLVLTGRRRREWGFHTEDGWVWWETYVAQIQSGERAR